ncbi:hypothetical protein HDU98_010622 [Podochytrium sp. JEL0797]|nr:hypothetical protein HDU98_010622 [Podochytrium sp. JEL0797]
MHDSDDDDDDYAGDEFPDPCDLIHWHRKQRETIVLQARNRDDSDGDHFILQHYDDKDDEDDEDVDLLWDEQVQAFVESSDLWNENASHVKTEKSLATTVAHEWEQRMEEEPFLDANSDREDDTPSSGSSSPVLSWNPAVTQRPGATVDMATRNDATPDSETQYPNLSMCRNADINLPSSEPPRVTAESAGRRVQASTNTDAQVVAPVSPKRKREETTDSSVRTDVTETRVSKKVKYIDVMMQNVVWPVGWMAVGVAFFMAGTGIFSGLGRS